MRIALIDLFFDTSHKKWALGLQKHSSHQIDIYSDGPHNWKWKMTGGALKAARRINDSGVSYQLFIVSDMVHLSLFKSLLNDEYRTTPIALYFHENQITYPWSPDDPDVASGRDVHYGFINYVSALTADKVFFNSNFHFENFGIGLLDFIKRFPEHGAVAYHSSIMNKSSVLPIGLELPEYQPSQSNFPVFLWNHRWEYDKQPELFFQTLVELKRRGIQFELIVLGRAFEKSPPIFEQIRSELKNEIIHFGFVESEDEYLSYVQRANILLITSKQDFFGISIVESIASGLYPILPDRLAFPEHVPNNFPGIYKKDQELIPLLMEVIKNKTYLRTVELSQFVQKYHWNKLVEQYDEAFSEMVQL